MNLAVSLLVLGGGALLVYTGVTDPEGGAFAEVGRVLRGDPPLPKRQPMNGVSDWDQPGAPTTPPGFGWGASSTAAARGKVTPAASSPVAPGSTAAAAAVNTARAQLGVPYRYGGTTPAGFDCSGLTQYAYAAAGIHLQRTAAAQQLTAGALVAGKAAALPGDLVFWGSPAHHVGIYVGGGRMIAAPHTGARVQLQDVYGTPSTWRRPAAAGRTVNA